MDATGRNTLKRILETTLVALLIFSQVAPVMGETGDALEFLQEEAKVVTASRREQKMSEIPVSVDVITAEEIQASGATNLWDLFRYRPGMNVMDGRSPDGQRGVVAMRGFAQEYV